MIASEISQIDKEIKMSKPAYCPNCGKAALLEGNMITCESCDATFKVTKEGIKIEKVGIMANHEKRLQALEKFHKDIEREVDNDAEISDEGEPPEDRMSLSGNKDSFFEP